MLADVDGHFKGLIRGDIEGCELGTVAPGDGNTRSGHVRVDAVIDKTKDRIELALTLCQLDIGDIGAAPAGDIGIREQCTSDDRIFLGEVGIDASVRANRVSR